MGRRYGAAAAIGLGVALGVGEMVRQFSLWTLAVVVLAFLAALWARAGERRRSRARSRSRSPAASSSQARGTATARRTTRTRSSTGRTSTSRCGSGGRRASISTRGCPTCSRSRTGRTSANLAVAADVHGHLGRLVRRVRVVGAPMRSRRPRRTAWLVAQKVVGLVPTALALVGWLVLLVALVPAAATRRGCSSRCCRSPASRAISTSR